METIAKEKEGATLVLARNVVGVKYEDLPKEAVEATKKSILDTLGVIIAASGLAPGIKELVELVKEARGKEESTIMGFGSRVPAWMAAFANGAMAHAVDYDDIHYGCMLHPSSSTVPAGFAVAERLGKVNGKEFITAIALGNDLISRLGLALPREPAWHRTPVFGIFAAAVTSGKLLKLDEEKMVGTLGNAFCQSAGTLQLRYSVGSDLGGMYAAFPAKGGVLSALMAERGITGTKESFEGKAGLFNVYFNGEYDRVTLLVDLGKRFEGANTSYKLWPACGNTLCYIDATLSIVNEQDIHHEDIEEIIVFVGNVTQNCCVPLEARRKPMTPIDAKYSIPFTVGLAASKRNVVIADFTSEGLRDRAVLELAQRVIPKYDERFTVGKGVPPGMVQIKTKKGEVYQKRVDFPLGHIKNPLSWQDLVAKFRDCSSYLVKRLPEENVEKVIRMATSLEQVDDVSQIIQLVSEEVKKDE